jgi:hypothetical protein
VTDEVDPFDLPDWVGEHDVSWASEGAVAGHLVTGSLTNGSGAEGMPCDLLAVDEAYPSPVLDEATRVRVHQAWRHGQVLLLDHHGRTTVAAPGTSWPVERVLEALTRMARAVGADPAAWSVRLGLGTSQNR